MKPEQIDLRKVFQDTIREATGITIETADLPLTGHIHWEGPGVLEIDECMITFPLALVLDFKPEEQTQIMLERIRAAHLKALDTQPS